MNENLEKNQLAEFINKPCIIDYYEGQEMQGIFFNWDKINDQSKEFFEDAVGDEMFENKDLIPIGIFSFLEDELNFSSCDDYVENVEQPEIYFMVNKKNGELYDGDDKLDGTLNDLNIRFKSE